MHVFNPRRTGEGDYLDPFPVYYVSVTLITLSTEPSPYLSVNQFYTICANKNFLPPSSHRLSGNDIRVTSSPAAFDAHMVLQEQQLSWAQFFSLNQFIKYNNIHVE